jgi:hypothetical protein
MKVSSLRICLLQVCRDFFFPLVFLTFSLLAFFLNIKSLLYLISCRAQLCSTEYFFLLNS